jgi:chemosensory pili system protein ChpA (sensor histidine kinase/response regulator)
MPDEIKRIGPLEISHGLYSIFLTEADECIRVLAQEIAEWRYEPEREVGTESAAALAFAVRDFEDSRPGAGGRDCRPAGRSAAHACRAGAASHQSTLNAAQFDTLERVLDRVRGMLHQFAAGVYPDDAPFEAGAIEDLVSVVRAAQLAASGRQKSLHMRRSICTEVTGRREDLPLPAFDALDALPEAAAKPSPASSFRASTASEHQSSPVRWRPGFEAGRRSVREPDSDDAEADACRCSYGRARRARY